MSAETTTPDVNARTEHIHYPRKSKAKDLNHMKTLSGIDWVNFAEEDSSIWEQIIGAKVIHPDFGEGEITKVESPIGPPLASVSFPSRTDKISAAYFRSGRLAIIVSDSLELQVREWNSRQTKNNIEREFESSKLKDNHRVLVEKYAVPRDFLYNDNWLKIVAILRKHENGIILDSSELSWLESNRLHKFVACNLVLRFEKHGDYGHLANACSFFRKANLPDEVILRTANLSPTTIPNKKILAELLTTRGAAYRDKGDLCQAERLAYEAIDACVTFHPYRLLGAISSDRGERIESEKFFEKAKTLGATQDNLIS